MKTKLISAAVAVASVSLAGCSSRPREFTPTLAVASADDKGFQEAHATCRQLLAEGKLAADGRAASTGAGAAAGATTAVVGGAAASAVGGWGGLAVASATIVALPFVAVGGAWGLAKKRKNRKERAIQTATAGCLGERGYAVAGWTPTKRAKPAR